MSRLKTICREGEAIASYKNVLKHTNASLVVAVWKMSNSNFSMDEGELDVSQKQGKMFESGCSMTLNNIPTQRRRLRASIDPNIRQVAPKGTFR